MPKVGHIILFTLIIFSALLLGREAFIVLSVVETKLKTTPKEASVVAAFPDVKPTVSTIKIKELTLNISLADTAAKREQGLSDTAFLATTSGMFFVFDKPDSYTFWMKDMSYPLDIIWISKNLRIVDISKNISPATYPNSFQPRVSVLYALEINAGLADEYNLQEGDSVNISL